MTHHPGGRMKGNFNFVLIAILFFTGCRENVIEYTLEESTASIFVYSQPLFADIFLNDQFTGKITPDILKNLEPGTYYIKLALEGFKDSTIIINASPAEKTSLYIILNRNK